MGWLNSTPTPQGERKSPGVARIVTLQNKANLGGEALGLDLPPVTAGEHIVGYLMDVGPAPAGETLTYGEINAWCSATGVVLTSWEAKALKQMSSAYLGGYHDGKEPGRKPPYLPVEGEAGD
jgi:hypothetical protein